MAQRLGDVIRARRAVRGYDREKLAELINCDVGTIGRWERYERPAIHYLVPIREVLDIPIELMDELVLEAMTREENGLRIEGPSFLERVEIDYVQLARELIALDYRTIGHEEEAFEGEAEQWAEVFEALPDTWRLLTKGREIVGNWQFTPLKPDAFAAAKDGSLLDSEISLDNIDDMQFPCVCNAYVPAVICDGQYRVGRSFKNLFDSMFEVLTKLAVNEVFLNEVCVAAWSPASVKLSERLGLRKVGYHRKSAATVPIYVGQMREILCVPELQRFERLRQLYDAV